MSRLGATPRAPGGVGGAQRHDVAFPDAVRQGLEGAPRRCIGHAKGHYLRRRCVSTLYCNDNAWWCCFEYAVAVAPSASRVHFDGGDGDTLRVVAASGRLRTAGATSFCMKMACMHGQGGLCNITRPDITNCRRRSTRLRWSLRAYVNMVALGDVVHAF